MGYQWTWSGVCSTTQIEALNISIYIVNWFPIKVDPKTPFEFGKVENWVYEICLLLGQDEVRFYDIKFLVRHFLSLTWHDKETYLNVPSACPKPI